MTRGNGCVRTEKWDKENALGFGYMEREVREDSATVDRAIVRDANTVQGLGFGGATGAVGTGVEIQ